MSALASLSGPSSETNRTRTMGARAVMLETCTNRSSGTRSLSRSLAVSLKLIRTSWQQLCYYATCLSPRTPRHGAFETRCKACSTWQQPSKIRAQPLDVEEQPQKSAPSQPETRERYQSTRSHHLEARRRCPFRNTSSTIEEHATLALILTSIDAVNTVTLRNGVTAPTTADIMTVTRTEWLPSRWALESLAGQSTACHCQAHSSLRPALPSTTAKPSQNCGWQTSGWHASWEAPEETIEPSSDSSRSSSPTPLEDGSWSS